MPSNVVSAILLTAVLFSSLAIAIDFAIESVKSIKMLDEAKRAGEILQEFAYFENKTFFYSGDGIILIREKNVTIDYCGTSEVLKAYSICYKYEFSKCIGISTEISPEKGKNGIILEVKASKIFQNFLSEPGRHLIKIEKLSYSENRSIFDLINTTSDQSLNLSASVSEITHCGEVINLEINAGESAEERYVAIIEREKVYEVKGASVEIIERSSKWFRDIGSKETSLSYQIDTSKWFPGYYGVLLFSNSTMNDNITILILGDVLVDYGFSKLNFTHVEIVKRYIDDVMINEVEWHS